jgi:hypothetical protein
MCHISQSYVLCWPSQRTGDHDRAEGYQSKGLNYGGVPTMVRAEVGIRWSPSTLLQNKKSANLQLLNINLVAMVSSAPSDMTRRVLVFLGGLVSQYIRSIPANLFFLIALEIQASKPQLIQNSTDNIYDSKQRHKDGSAPHRTLEGGLIQGNLIQD